MFIQQTSHNFKQEAYSESDFGRIICAFFRFEFSIIIYGTLDVVSHYLVTIDIVDADSSDIIFG